MASTSNGNPTTTHGVIETPDNSTFDLDQGLAVIALWRDGPVQVYDLLGLPDCNDVLSGSLVDASRATATDLFRISQNEESENGADCVPMQLLNLGEQEKADLLLVHPKAKVTGDCISTTDYVFVVKRLLFDVTVDGVGGVRHPEAYARLLRRLSRELRSWHFDSDSMLNPRDYVGCLDEMRKDMEGTWERLKNDGETRQTLDEIWGEDGYVYVRRRIDTYVGCLLAAANALSRV